MSARYAYIVILAEDLRSANLLRRYVQRALKLTHRQIRQVDLPAGKGDAKQWVVSQYPLQVREFRRKAIKKALIVHIDADVATVKHRSEQLATSLRTAGMDERGDDEQIVHAIPRRHTETWLCALTGIEVDEEMDCKRLRLPPEPDKAVLPAALELIRLSWRNAPEPKLPSLIAAVAELRRLEDKG